MSYGKWSWQEVDIEVLLGKVITGIVNNGNEELEFTTEDGEVYSMYHEQDCCEYVSIEDITGELTDLLNTPITMAEEVTEDGGRDVWESITWTFYKLATVNGYVTIRWYGESNGYYSERVSFVRKPKEEQE